MVCCDRVTERPTPESLTLRLTGGGQQLFLPLFPLLGMWGHYLCPLFLSLFIYIFVCLRCALVNACLCGGCVSLDIRYSVSPLVTMTVLLLRRWGGREGGRGQDNVVVLFYLFYFIYFILFIVFVFMCPRDLPTPEKNANTHTQTHAPSASNTFVRYEPLPTAWID